MDACTNARLEGFIVSNETEKLFHRYINGELTQFELNSAVLQMASKCD